MIFSGMLPGDRYELARFVERNRYALFVSMSFVLQVAIMFLWFEPGIEYNKLDDLVEEVAFIDSISIKEPADSKPDDGDFELTDKQKKEKEDPRIAGAQDVIISGATSPVDLSPGIAPEYTSEAKSAGITGTITLEVVIADSGEVLRVRILGNRLGYGLEEAAIATFMRKKFSPSILEGKALTVKVLIPVRFTLH